MSYKVDIEKLDKLEYLSPEWIEEFLRQKPKIKEIEERVPERHLGYRDVATLVSERVGFQYPNVSEVLREYHNVVHEILVAGGSYYFPKIGSFFLKVVGPRIFEEGSFQARNLPAGEKMYIPPRRIPHFHPNQDFKAFCKTLTVSKFDLEAAYNGIERTEEQIEAERRRSIERLLTGNTCSTT